MVDGGGQRVSTPCTNPGMTITRTNHRPTSRSAYAEVPQSCWSGPQPQTKNSAQATKTRRRAPHATKAVPAHVRARHQQPKERKDERDAAQRDGTRTRFAEHQRPLADRLRQQHGEGSAFALTAEELVGQSDHDQGEEEDEEKPEVKGACHRRVGPSWRSRSLLELK